MRIGVFDSGLGGLTVLDSLIKKYPNNEYIYFGDTLNMPYGGKTKEELYELSSKIVEFLKSKKVDLIIIACGTVSSNNYLELKRNFDIPIYDILTPTINYLNQSNLSNIGVIATEMTIKSGIFNNVNKPVIQIYCPKFVPLIENNMIDTIEMENAINEYLKGKYGADNVHWNINSVDDIFSDPTRLKGYTADELQTILGNDWTRGVYGSNGGGWKLMNGDISIFYHPGGGKHGGSYYGISSGATGKIKVVNPETYIPLKGDKATVIYD